MQIQMLSINGKKCLKNVEIPFCISDSSSTTILIGENGTGKTTVIEAILEILMSFDSPAVEKQIDYSYEIKYEYAQKQIVITKVNDYYTVFVDDSYLCGSYAQVRSMMQEYRLFPKRIISFYSGTNNKLKAKVIQYENFDFNTPLANSGYYWLRNDITNYRASCAFCNRKTGDGGKGNFFPLQPGSPRLTPNGNETEQPLLLDPCNQQDVRIISFLVKDVICASIQPGDNDRVKASTVIYNLNHPDIVDKRAKVWEAVAQAIASYNAGNMNQTECLRQLNLYTARDAECSACAIACVNSLAPDEIKALLNLQL